MQAKVSVSKFNYLLESWASQSPPIMHFTVENVLDTLGLDSSYYSKVLDLLMKRNGDEIIAQKVALCPSNHKLLTFLIDEEVDENFECFCQEDEFEVTKFKLVFSFEDDFKADSLKKKRIE